MIFRLGYHDGVHVDAGEADHPGVQRAVFHHPLHLDNDRAAGVMGGLGLGQRLGIGTLPLKGAVALGIGIGGPEDGHVNGDGGVKQLFLPLKLDHLDEIPLVPGGLVQLAALQPGIGKGAEAHMGDHTGAPGGDLPEKLGEGALGKVIARQLIIRRQLAQTGSQSPVAADDLPKQAAHRQVVQAPGRAVPLSRGIDERQPLRASRLGREPQLLHNLLRVREAVGKAAHRDGGTVMDVGADSLLRRHLFWHTFHFLSNFSGSRAKLPLESGRANLSVGL